MNTDRGGWGRGEREREGHKYGKILIIGESRGRVYRFSFFQMTENVQKNLNSKT